MLLYKILNSTFRIDVSLQFRTDIYQLLVDDDDDDDDGDIQSKKAFQ